MKSNFKPIGNYIQKVENRNWDLKVTKLLGLSMTKEFRETTSNIIGTDMSVYKVMQKYQFACDFMSPIRVNKLPVVLKLDEEPNLVSPAYPVFEVIDRNELDPEYLMMWFRRPEFDRYATFKCDAAIRGGFDWDELCDTLIPVPSITKQREIVKEYNTIQKRIELNQQMIQKLEETAQAIYKRWFVEFEFPDENGKPYKSNNGEMIWNEELGKEIPKSWKKVDLKEVMDNFDSKRKPLGSSERINRERVYPYYGAASLMDYIDDYIFDGTYILLGEDGTVITDNGTPVLQYVWGKFWVNNHAHVLKGKNGFDENILYIFLKNTNVTEIITGGVQAKINQANLNSISILKPSIEILNKYRILLNSVFDLFKTKNTENQKLLLLKNLLLSKLATIENKK